MSKLDKFDLKLLAELENDSRQALSQIAKKLGTSQQVVSYRMKTLEKQKVIGGYFAMINFTTLGYTNYRTMIRFTNITESRKTEIVNYLMKHPNILWLVECGGRWDLIANFMARNIIQYGGFIKTLKNKFPEQVQNYDVLTTIEAIYFGRDYFIKKSREIRKLPYFGREFRLEKIDEMDKKILGLISENARMPSAEISEKIDLSANAIILRIKNMIRKGIIQGFKPLIHLENTPYSAYKALVKFQNITEAIEKEIINYLNTNISITGIIKQIGLWDFEIEFEVDSNEKMLELTRNFRDRFKDVIKEFEIIPLFHEFKYNYFPTD
jgi:Lrp/AsnC family transcriptional regulator for asnA, asnC and gidA